MAPVRNCEGCGKPLTSRHLWCEHCRATDRACEGCGKTFTGRYRRCGPCRCAGRICEQCGRPHTSTARLCHRCRATDRVCAECGKSFKGNQRHCNECRLADRACEGCGKTIKRTALLCDGCWRAQLSPEERSARDRSQRNCRRARQVDAEVSGPVPRKVYVRIRESGPCVYCGAVAEHVDHVFPLSRGGWEHESNLVPACAWCNTSKGDRLLTEWHPDWVAHGVACSPVVAREWERLTDALPVSA